MSEHTSVTLSELEFNKLVRYSEAVMATEAQAELALNQLREKVVAAQKQRESYFLGLIQKYPELNPTVNYNADEATLSLVPVVKQG